MSNFHEGHYVHLTVQVCYIQQTFRLQQELVHTQLKDHLGHSKKWSHTRMNSHCFSSVCDVVQLRKIEAFVVTVTF